jgi:hypothetical protein
MTSTWEQDSTERAAQRIGADLPEGDLLVPMVRNAIPILRAIGLAARRAGIQPGLADSAFGVIADGLYRVMKAAYAR